MRGTGACSWIDRASSHSRPIGALLAKCIPNRINETVVLGIAHVNRTATVPNYTDSGTGIRVFIVPAIADNIEPPFSVPVRTRRAS